MAEARGEQLSFLFEAKGESDVYMLDLDQVDHYWPKIAALLDAEPELWEGCWTKEGIYAALMEKRVQAWAICSEKDGPITTVFFSQVLVFETGKSLHIWWMRGVGAVRAFECASVAVEAFGRYAGCKDLLVTGRKGLERVLAAFGGKVESVTLRKELPQKPVRH